MPGRHREVGHTADSNFVLSPMLTRTLLLKGGTVATFIEGAAEPKVFKADVLVEGDTITRIEETIDVRHAGVEVIDCQDKWITPGMVDTHR